MQALNKFYQGGVASGDGGKAQKETKVVRTRTQGSAKACVRWYGSLAASQESKLPARSSG